MFNKVYVTIKDFIKRNFICLLILLITSIIFLVPLPYDVEMPGGIINLENRVKVNGEVTHTEGSFNMAYVSVGRGTIPFVLFGLLFDDWEVVPQSNEKYDNESIQDAYKRDKLYLEQSINYAIAVGMDAANVPYEVSNKNNIIVYIDEKANTDLKVGDDIVSINGIKINETDEISDIVANVKVGDEISLTVLRDKKKVEAKAIIYEEDGKHYIGVSSITTFDIDSDTKVEIDSKMSESGPSGGMMMSLMVYNALTNQDLTHGKVVVGTGTISLDGSVGEIGGVKYKIMGAVRQHADIFLVPDGNYDEAVDVAKEKNYNINIVRIKTLQDAINYLEGL